MSTDAWIAVLNYIDTNIDDIKDRSKENEKKVDKLKEDFDKLKEDVGDVKAIIESNTELSKTIKKTALGTVVSIVLGYIAMKLGIVG
ncbi:hypothetical protein [Macrococcus animalis]|uniref:hypothetical protein n=1 Tax=Macrococcus animalis TaxID=3395467 RepID=UPI0039BE99C3